MLRDLNRRLGLALPLDGPKTLNGLLVEMAQIDSFIASQTTRAVYSSLGLPASLQGHAR